MKQLKPCPFCGSTDLELNLEQSERVQFVICCSCLARGPAVPRDRFDSFDKNSVINAWNEKDNSKEKEMEAHWKEAFVKLELLRNILSPSERSILFGPAGL